MAGKRLTGIESKLIHAGRTQEFEGAVSVPIFQSSTFLSNFDGEANYYTSNRYIRLNNTPNHDVIHARIAAIEEAENALVFASGMAAISTVLLTFLKAGDHILAQDCLYGGTVTFVTHDLPQYNIMHDFIDATKPQSWEAKLKPNTKLIYVEAATNPLLQVADHKSVVAFARKHNLLAIIDATTLTPIFFKPIPFGYDIVVHSCTKYMNGHADLVAGCASGRNELMEKVRIKHCHLGATLDPHTVFLLERGLKTLSLRMKQHDINALKVAKFLEKHPAVKRVNHPGLESHADHARAKELFGGFGSLFSFELKSKSEEEAERLALKFVKSVRLFTLAPSLGGTESLITLPSRTSHASMTKEERLKAGVGSGLIRLSVGLETTEDLIADLEQGFALLTLNARL